jgi:hypothetical protein
MEKSEVDLTNYFQQSTIDFEGAYQIYTSKRIKLMNCDCILCNHEKFHFQTWKQIVHFALIAMTLKENKQYFHFKNDIVPFIDIHWSKLWNRNSNLLI